MIILLMGVAGSGKATIGKQLAAELGWEFIDADDFHPPGNIKKMASGIPLTDDDRKPWLAQLNTQLHAIETTKGNVVLACSALKKSYRDILSQGVSNFRTVFLKGDYDLIEKRMQERSGHYMKPAMLKSQFETLEEPLDEISIDVGPTPAIITSRIREVLGI